MESKMKDNSRGLSRRRNSFVGLYQLLLTVVVLGLLCAAPNAPSASASTDRVTFQLSDGDTVTCIPFLEQPSLINHTDAQYWPRWPTTEVIPGNSTYSTHGVKRASQTLAEDAGGCPDGTIPTRADRGIWNIDSAEARSARGARLRELARRKFEARYLFQARAAAPAFNFTTNYSLTPHEWSVGMSESDNTKEVMYKGTEVFINIWEPYVEGLGEFSLAQLWLIGQHMTNTTPGNITYSKLNTIEVGYQVSTGHYGDGLPRLFIFWTSDSYRNGCYDSDCAGFVQVSNKVLLGGSFTPTSRVLGQQYEIKLRVFKDDQTGDWWLQLNDELVGYWPKSIFTNLQGLANAINWGGEIVDDQPHDGGFHTRTQMGSGEFASAGFKKAAYMRNLQYIDHKNNLYDAPILDLFNSSAGCYSIARGHEFADWGMYMFYGGKGRNKHCLSDRRIPVPGA